MIITKSDGDRLVLKYKEGSLMVVQSIVKNEGEQANLTRVPTDIINFYVKNEKIEFGQSNDSYKKVIEKIETCNEGIKEKLKFNIWFENIHMILNAILLIGILITLVTYAINVMTDGNFLQIKDMETLGIFGVLVSVIVALSFISGILKRNFTKKSSMILFWINNALILVYFGYTLIGLFIEGLFISFITISTPVSITILFEQILIELSFGIQSKIKISNE